MNLVRKKESTLNVKKWTTFDGFIGVKKAF